MKLQIEKVGPEKVYLVAEANTSGGRFASCSSGGARSRSYGYGRSMTYVNPYTLKLGIVLCFFVGV